MPPSSNVSSERVEGDFAKVQGTKWSSTGAIPCKSYKHLKPFGEMIQFDFRNRIFCFKWVDEKTKQLVGGGPERMNHMNYSP